MLPSSRRASSRALSGVQLAHTLGRILAPERKQWIAHPPAPVLEATERTAGFNIDLDPSPAPDRQQGGQQFRSPRRHLGVESILKGLASGSSVRGSSSTMMNRRARSSDTLSPFPVKITRVEEFSDTI